MHSVRRRPLAAALLFAPALAGCFAPGSDSAPGSAAGGRLRVALAFPPAEDFSPFGADATLLTRLGVTEGLTRLADDGTAVPALAESWHRENNRSWLFSLREARFQDGTTVTPEAVADALTHAARAEPTPAALSGVDLSAEAADDRRVRVTTAEPDPVMPLRLSSPSLVILAAKAYRKGGPPDPAGAATGTFELTRVRGAARATLDRFDGHWGGRARSTGIDVQFVADGTARTNALRSGAVDIAEAIPVSQVASLDEGTVREVATSRTTSLFLNTRKGPFADPGIRAAAREAVGTRALAEGVFEGHADPGVGVFGPGLSWAAEERIRPTGRVRAGTGTRITLGTYDNRPELPEVAQVLQQQLEKAGFRVRLEVREYARVESDALAGRFDAFVAARNTLLDTGDPVSILASDYTCDGDYNLALLCEASVDRAVAEADALADTRKRQRAATAAEAEILGTDAVVPLVHQRILHGVAQSVRGVLLDPYERTLIGAETRR